MKIKSMFHFEDLHCHECAEHIIDIIEHNDDVSDVIVDFDKKNITVIGDRKFSYEEVSKIINYVKNNEHNEHKHEHEHEHEKTLQSLGGIVTEEYSFEDIDCPNCAAKVERALNKNKDILDARVNFITKKIIIKHNDNCQVYNIVTKIVKSVECDAKVYKPGMKHVLHEDHNFECHEHGCNCHGHHHRHEHEKEKNSVKVIIIFLGFMLFLASMSLKLLGIENIYSKLMFLVSYGMLSYDLFYEAFVNIIHKDFFSESTLMIVASLGAVLIGEQFEGIMVILLFKIGEFCQDRATEKSRRAIKDLVDMRVDEVTLKDGTVKKVDEVNVGEIVTVKVGERIPLDGVIKEGSTEVDMKALTGESIPAEVKSGEEILSGSINLTRVIDIEVTKISSDSTMTKVLKLVEEASNQKSKSEKFITKFARIYTPCILIIAILVGVIQGFVIGNLKEVFNNVFAILVISCPCALVISIPLGYFAGIGRSSNEGILVKGGNYLEALTETESIVFDKTGTITKGNFKVLEVLPIKGKTIEEVIKYVTMVEQYSLHPIASSIKNEFGKDIKFVKDAKVEEISGEGIKLDDNNQTVIVGNEKLMNRFNVKFEKCKKVGTILYLAVNNEYYGCVVIGDEIKEEAKPLFNYLHAANIKTVMLTGDSEVVAKDISSKLGIDETYSKLLPSQKYEILKDKISKKTGTIVYVGDGINDTPSLKLADVGIAMGAVGSDSAKEVSDIVIMNDDISKVKTAIDISKYTKKIVTENIIFALAIKLIALIIGITGVLSSLGMLIAIFADVGTCLICILNVMRILRCRKKSK